MLIMGAFWVLFWVVVAAAMNLWTLARQRRWRQEREATELEFDPSTHDARDRPAGIHDAPYIPLDGRE